MKKLLIVILVIAGGLVSSNLYAETQKEPYGCYENKNEISAKDSIIPYVDIIFDYENSVNANGDKIEDGKFYIPITYKGGYNGKDTDYIYLEDILKTKTPTNYDKKQDIRIDDIDNHNDYQDMRLDANKNNILKNRQKITDINNIHTNWNKKQDKTIDRNTQRSKKNKDLIKKETTQRKKADDKLNDKIIINKNNINTNKKKIKNINNKHTDWNTTQDNALNDHDNRITSNTNRIDNHENRIDDLEDTQYCIRGEVQFIRKENLTVGVYGKTDVRHPNINNEVGINIVIGLGKSEAQEKRENLEKRVANLEKKLGWIGIEPEVKKTKTGWEISIREEDKIKLLNKF
jgi:hypothetical protein